LFTAQPLNLENQQKVLDVLPRLISQEENEQLIQPITEQELYTVVFSMAK
ncbi:hypothetical protein KI387_018587, partial [Taxus chinensis]